MFLAKDGITIEVSHPADIRRYKSLGFVCPRAVTEPEDEIPSGEAGEVEKPAPVKVSHSKDGKNG